jgi:DNA polymerase-3 subunit beta
MMHTSIPDSATAIPAAVVFGGVMEATPLSDLDNAPAEPVVVEPPPPSVEIKASALVTRAALSAAVTAVMRCIEKRNTIPVLANVLLKAHDNGLLVVGTNLDVEMSAFVDGAADAGFATTLPAHHLADLLKKAKASDEVEIDMTSTTVWRAPYNGEKTSKKWVGETEDSIGLDFAGLRVSMKGHPAVDFPEVADTPMPHVFTMPSAEIARVLDKTTFAISTEETRYYLNGVYMHRDPTPGTSTLRFVATDGHRLAKLDTALPAGAENLPGIIVHRNTLAILAKLCSGKGVPESVKIEVGGPVPDGETESIAAKVRFTVGGVVILAKLVDGTFPDYGRVIPTGNDKHLTVACAALSAGIEQVSCVSSERGRAVKLSIAGDRLRLCVTNPDLGSASTDLAVTYDSDPLDIGFNGRYLSEILENVDGDNVTLHLADPGSPMLIRGDADSEKDTLYVLMPMRV